VEGLELANRITEVIVDRQGEDILILDLKDVTTFTDYFVLCTTSSRRQMDVLASTIREEMKKDDVQQIPLNVEGEPDSGWILMDYNSVIVHLLSEEMRAFYRLEELWRSARIVASIQ
jgi:ribosome-associated protein